MTDEIKKLGTILCVFAHPDDETTTMGGLLTAAAANGQRLVIITATRGEGGVQDEARWPADELGSIRSAELEQALQILGVSDQHFLNYKDGECQQADTEAAAEQISEFIKQYQPDSIFSFGPDGLTGHTDHQAVSAWAARARAAVGSQADLYYAVLTPEQYKGFNAPDKELNFFFAIDNPPLCPPEETAICFRLDDQLFGKKMAALQAMPSQYDAVFSRFSADNLRAGFGTEAFISAA